MSALNVSGLQSTLKKVRECIQNKEDVDVTLQPEPDNVYDPRAIAFVCRVDGRWQRIGYIVKEMFMKHQILLFPLNSLGSNSNC